MNLSALIKSRAPSWLLASRALEQPLCFSGIHLIHGFYHTHSRHANHDDVGRRSTKFRRTSVACRRCRRLRTKCINESRDPPCKVCLDAGADAARSCVFPNRGDPISDREFRRERRRRGQEASNSGTASSPSIGAAQQNERSDRSTSHASTWGLMPSLSEVIEGCTAFITSYFQVGFLPKAVFLETLRQEPESLDPFLLVAILSVSARFTPSLVNRYGSDGEATEHFLTCASLLVPLRMYDPTLENVQSFFLLAIAEWGKGERSRSSVNLAISIRLAGLLGLHQERTYLLDASAMPQDINLLSGKTAPSAFSMDDITTLLPCDESDFVFGIRPDNRCDLHGSFPGRSLFATLIQVHHLWAKVARGISEDVADGYNMWDEASKYVRLSDTLLQWELRLPQRHKWSSWNLRGHKADGHDLAYLTVVMLLRLCNVVLRRNAMQTVMDQPPSQWQPRIFWEDTASSLYENVMQLHEQICAFSSLERSQKGFPALIAFCVYICGSLAHGLLEKPHLCPNISEAADPVFRQSVQTLKSLQRAWPLARRWYEALHRLTTRPQGHLSFDHPREHRENSSTTTLGTSNTGHLAEERHNLQCALSTDQDGTIGDYCGDLDAQLDSDLPDFLAADMSFGFLEQWTALEETS